MIRRGSKDSSAVISIRPLTTVEHIPRLGVARAARCVGLFFAAWLGGSLAFRAVAPFPRIPQVSEKLEQFADGKACNLAFFGTSKIYSGVIPKLFDEYVRANGVAVRSFNFGVDGMSFPETGYFAEEVLARCPGRLKWVFIEANTLRTAIPERYRDTRRVVYWHDVRRTVEILRAIYGADFPLRHPKQPRATLVPEHARLFAMRTGNLGDGSALLQETFLGRGLPGPRDRFEGKKRGYLPIHAQMNAHDATRMRTALAQVERPWKLSTDRVSEEALYAFAKRIERAGARPIFITSPNAQPTTPIFQRWKQRGAPAVFAFDDPARYPQLYREDYRADFVHLNDAGAREFTMLLAKRFAALVEAHP